MTTTRRRRSAGVLSGGTAAATRTTTPLITTRSRIRLLTRSNARVQGGAMNSPDAKYCDQCGAGLYSADGTIIISDDGVPVDVQGDPAMSLALRQRQVELLSLAGALTDD